MKKVELIKLAVSIAVEAHADHVDKGGAPYVSHVMRVADKVKGRDAIAVAVLHDVIEDSEISFDELLRRGIPLNVVELVAVLTRKAGEKYADYIVRVGYNPVARAIKIADLEDNMDLKRLPKVGKSDLVRLNKYINAYKYLVELL